MPHQHELLVSLAAVVVLGVGAQWLASRIRLPSILLLLTAGILAGPVAHMVSENYGYTHLYLDPDYLFGHLLLPLVSISVAIILYEGGLSLRMQELKQVGKTVRNLVTIGALVTWILASACAYFITDMELRMAVLLGAVLVVTGPTVIQPLLQHIRPSGQVGHVLKWEGIVIDPIGVLLALLVFEVIFSGQLQSAPQHAAMAIGKTILIGGGLAVLAASLLVLLLHKFWIPDHLQNAVSLGLCVGTFTVSNLFQAESGLFAVTLMGFLLANQKFVGVEHIIEFKENLRVLLLSSLFILLAARLDLEHIVDLKVGTIIFVVAMILVVRPASVFIATLGCKLTLRERLFLSWMAPRGIVAAAVSSVFALALESAGVPNADLLLSITFATIIGTVAFYGLTAPLAAVKLKLADRQPQGILFVGADEWVRALAKTLQDCKVAVTLVDTNRAKVAAAKLAGLPAHNAGILDENLNEMLDLGGLGRLLAVTRNDWVNRQAAQHFNRVFGTAGTFRLTPEKRSASTKKKTPDTEGRILFGDDATYSVLRDRYAGGSVFKATALTKKFNFEQYLVEYGHTIIPLFIINSSGRLGVVTEPESLAPEPGYTIIALVDEPEEPTPDQ